MCMHGCGQWPAPSPQSPFPVHLVLCLFGVWSVQPAGLSHTPATHTSLVYVGEPGVLSGTPSLLSTSGACCPFCLTTHSGSLGQHRTCLPSAEAWVSQSWRVSLQVPKGPEGMCLLPTFYRENMSPNGAGLKIQVGHSHQLRNWPGLPSGL